jgi:hypothetical protein
MVLNLARIILLLLLEVQRTFEYTYAGCIIGFCWLRPISRFNYSLYGPDPFDTASVHPFTFDNLLLHNQKFFPRGYSGRGVKLTTH